MINIVHRLTTVFLMVLVTTLPSMLTAEPFRILWWSSSVSESKANSTDRQGLAAFLNSYDGGQTYQVDYQFTTQGGAFARHMQTNRYDLIVFDATHARRGFNSADLDAIRRHYAESARAIMLDGSLWIRNTRYNRRTTFPGDNDVLAGLLINQIEALRTAGGGVLIGTDHAQFQVPANQVLGAILPGAAFRGTTNPSTDGEFVGDLLVAGTIPVKPADILRHWEVIPNQGQAPTGQFTDFLGNPITLHSLVDISDKPGGRRKRSYVSSSLTPGADRYAVDSEVAPEREQQEPDNMPTRKGPDI